MHVWTALCSWLGAWDPRHAPRCDDDDSDDDSNDTVALPRVLGTPPHEMDVSTITEQIQAIRVHLDTIARRNARLADLDRRCPLQSQETIAIRTEIRTTLDQMEERLVARQRHLADVLGARTGLSSQVVDRVGSVESDDVPTTVSCRPPVSLSERPSATPIDLDDKQVPSIAHEIVPACFSRQCIPPILSSGHDV